MRAVICVALTMLTSLTAIPPPLIATVVPLTKPLPVSVMVTAAPATALLGLRAVRDGAPAVTVKVSALVVPAGVVIVSVRLPSGASAAIAAVAVAVVLFTTVTLLTAMPLPLRVTVGGAPVLEKFVPDTVRGSVVPAVPEDGVTADSAGGVALGEVGVSELHPATNNTANKKQRFALTPIRVSCIGGARFDHLVHVELAFILG
jgi:hypothetical protein